jgi:hypothetical protein
MNQILFLNRQIQKRPAATPVEEPTNLAVTESGELIENKARAGRGGELTNPEG